MASGYKGFVLNIQQLERAERRVRDLEYRINKKRATEVFGTLLNMLRKRQHPFDHSEPPQVESNMPANLPRGGVEHGLFLWMVCYYMKGGIDSDTAFRALALLYEKSPELFVPAWIRSDSGLGEELDGLKGKELREKVRCSSTYVKLSEALRYHGLGFSLDSNTCFWILNALKFDRYWNGNVMNLWSWVKSYDDLVKVIANKGVWKTSKRGGFLGFQEKMVSMIAYFLGSTKLIDNSRIPVPVDFHVIRILIATRIITPELNVREKDENLFSKELLECGREVTAWYAMKVGIDMVELCDALWLYSRAMCSYHPDTVSVTKGKSYRRKQEQKLRADPTRVEVTEDLSEPRGRKAIIEPIHVTWNESQRAAYDRSCGQCPIVHVCKWAIPAAHYYVQARVVRRVRTTPPDDLQPLLLKVGVKIRVVPWDKAATLARFAVSHAMKQHVEPQQTLKYHQLDWFGDTVKSTK